MLLSAVPIVTPALAFTCYDLVRYIWSPEHGLEQGSSQVSKPRFRGKCCTANATRLRKNITTLEVPPHWEIEDLMCRARLGVERDLLRASVSRRSTLKVATTTWYSVDGGVSEAALLQPVSNGIVPGEGPARSQNEGR